MARNGAQSPYWIRRLRDLLLYLQLFAYKTKRLIHSLIKSLLHQRKAHEYHEVILPYSPNPHVPLNTGTEFGIVSVIIKGCQILIVPAIKLYQAWNYYVKKDPNAEKPTFTLNDGLYLGLDIVLFGLAIGTLILLKTIAGTIIAAGASLIGLGVGIYQYWQFWREKKAILQEINEIEEIAEEVRLPEQSARLEYLYQYLNTTVHNRYLKAKRTIGITLTGLGLVSTGLILGGLMLGPVGLPAISAGIAIGIGVMATAVTLTVCDLVKTYLDKKFEENPEKFLNNPLFRLYHRIAGKRNVEELVHAQNIELEVIQRPMPVRSPTEAAELLVPEERGDIPLMSFSATESPRFRH